MTLEQYTALIPWENVLTLAIEHSFIHLTNKEFGEIHTIYAELFGALPKHKLNCNTCRLKAIQKLADEYFNYKHQSSKKKAGRPKKI